MNKHVVLKCSGIRKDEYAPGQPCKKTLALLINNTVQIKCPRCERIEIIPLINSSEQLKKEGEKTNDIREKEFR